MSTFEEVRALGAAAYGEHRYRDAVAHYTRAIDLAGEDTRHLMYSNRCAAYQQLHDWTRALEDAESVTALKPGFAKGWSRLGTCLSKLGRRQEAKAAFEKATELDPRSFPPPRVGGQPRDLGGLFRQIVSDPAQRQYLFLAAALVVGWFLFKTKSRSGRYGGNATYSPRGGGSYGGYGPGLSGYGSGGGVGLAGLAALMVGAWKLPPLYGHPPFFGMSPMTLFWLLQSFAGGRGCSPFGCGSPFGGGGLFGGRRGGFPMRGGGGFFNRRRPGYY